MAARQVHVDVGDLTSAVAEGRLEEALALTHGELLPEVGHDRVYDARDPTATKSLECSSALLLMRAAG